MSLKRFLAARRAEAESERYRRYAEAKRKIPMNLSPREYEVELNTSSLLQRLHLKKMS